jgi:hypothetical protein
VAAEAGSDGGRAGGAGGADQRAAAAAAAGGGAAAAVGGAARLTLTVLDGALPEPLLRRLQAAFAPAAPFWREHGYGPRQGYFSYMFPLVRGYHSSVNIKPGAEGVAEPSAAPVISCNSARDSPASTAQQR